MADENTEENEWILDLPLSKSGNSLSVNVPRKILTALNLGIGDKVRVTLKSKR